MARKPEDPRFSEIVRGTFGDAAQKHDMAAVMAALVHPRCLDVNVVMPSPTQSRETVLFRLMGHKDTEVLDLLLSVGADVHHRSASGHTPLTAAATAGNLLIAQGLVKAGALVNDDRLDRQPLHCAARGGRLVMAQWLLDQGADLNRISGMGRSVLHDAVQYPAMVRLLLDAGADPHVQDFSARTPLEAAQALYAQPDHAGHTDLGASVALLERWEIREHLDQAPQEPSPDSVVRVRSRL